MTLRVNKFMYNIYNFTAMFALYYLFFSKQIITGFRKYKDDGFEEVFFFFSSFLARWQNLIFATELILYFAHIKM